MRPRFNAITKIIGVLWIVGGVGLGARTSDLTSSHDPLAHRLALVDSILALVFIVIGVEVLRRKRWAWWAGFGVSVLVTVGAAMQAFVKASLDPYALPWLGFLVAFVLLGMSERTTSPPRESGRATAAIPVPPAPIALLPTRGSPEGQPDSIGSHLGQGDERVPETDPSRAPLRHGKRPALVGAGAVSLILVTVIATLVLDRRPGGDPPPPSRSPTTGPSPTVSPSSTPHRGNKVCSSVLEEPCSTAIFPASAQAGPWQLDVVSQQKSSDCLTHTFSGAVLAIGGAYSSDCTSWLGSGLDLYFFDVEIKNLSGRPQQFILQRLVVLDGQRAVHVPLYARDHFKTPQAALLQRVTVPPHASVRGWVTFDARIDFVPRSISYSAETATATVRFEGRHRVLSRT